LRAQLFLLQVHGNVAGECYQTYQYYFGDNYCSNATNVISLYLYIFGDSFSLATPAQKSIKLGLFDAFLHETKESGRKKCRSASRSEILIVKVGDLTGYETCHTDEIRRNAHARNDVSVRCAHIGL